MWIHESKRRVFLDMHFPDWINKQTATDFNPQRIADTFDSANIDSAILYAKCQYGNFYYDTAIGHKHQGLEELDFFKETASRLREKNIRVIAYYSVAWDEYYAKLHPEWQVRQADGRQGSDEFRWSTLCINTSYKEIVLQHLHEIATQLKPDGYWIDMTIIGKDCCYCEACQSKFQSQYHTQIPVKAKSDDSIYQKFIQFRYHYIESFYQEIYDLLHRLQPEAMITNNYWGYPYSSHTMGSRACGALKLVDYVTGEAYTDWTGLAAPGFFCRWLRCAGSGRPYEALISRFIGTWDYTIKPNIQLAQEAFTVAANGGTVTIDDMPFSNGSLDWPLYKEIGGIFAEICRRQAFLGGEAITEGAIFHSQATKDEYFHGEAAFISTITGAVRMMHELHIDVDFLFDETVTSEQMSKYRYILLPRVAVLRSEQQQMLLDYVAQGGLLMIVGEMGWMPGTPLQKSGPSLFWDELGIELKEMVDHSISYISLLPSLYTEGIPIRPLTIRSPYIISQGEDIEVIAWVEEAICQTSKETFFHNNLPAPYKVTETPAIWKKKFGKGILFFFAQDVFAQFATYHQTDLKRLFQNIIHHHTPVPGIVFHCPSAIETAAWQKDGMLVLHLVNMVSGMTMCTGLMDTFQGRYQRTFEFIEEIVPVSDLWIEINNWKGIPTNVQAFETNEEVPEYIIENMPGGFIIRIPKLSQWITLVIHK